MGLWRVAALAVAIAAFLDAGSTYADTAPVRLEFSAPAGCSDAAAFAREISGRGVSLQRPAPGEKSWLLHVEIEPTAQGARGRLTFIEPDGRSAERRLRAADCRQASTALALIAAVVLGEGVGASSPSAPGSATGASPTPGSPSGAGSTAPPAPGSSSTGGSAPGTVRAPAAGSSPGTAHASAGGAAPATASPGNAPSSATASSPGAAPAPSTLSGSLQGPAPTPGPAAAPTLDAAGAQGSSLGASPGSASRPGSAPAHGAAASGSATAATADSETEPKQAETSRPDPAPSTSPKGSPPSEDDRSRGSVGISFGVAASSLLVFGAAPAPLVGAAGALGITFGPRHWPGTALVQLGFDATATGSFAESGGTASFEVLEALARGCPVALALPAGGLLRPCAIGVWGVLHASGADTSNPAAVDPRWQAAGLEGLLSWKLVAPLWLDLGFGGLLPIDRPRFRIGAEQVFETPPLIGRATVGLAVMLP